MAELIITEKQNIVALANSIRNRTEETDLLTIGEMIDDIGSIAGGVELPQLTNEGSAGDLLSGKELIDGDGNVVTGSFTLESEITTQDNLIAQIQSAVDNLPDAESGNGNSFPYNVTVVTSGIDNASPVICYGNTGNYILIITEQNKAAGYDVTWSYTNCKKALVATEVTYLGDYGMFHDFTDDAIITIDWTLNGAYDR